MEWQPIETAPRDGTFIALWFPRYRFPLWAGKWDGQRCRRSVTGIRNRSNPSHWAPITPPESGHE